MFKPAKDCSERRIAAWNTFITAYVLFTSILLFSVIYSHSTGAENAKNTDGSYGVELFCENTYRVVPLRAEIVYPIVVKNIGNLSDRFQFTISKLSPTHEESKWQTYVNKWSVDLLPGEEGIVNLSVKPTCTCQANLYILVTLTAISQGNNSIYASITTNTTAGDLGLVVDCPHPTIQSLPGTESNFTILVQNSGTITERFFIEHEGIPESWITTHLDSIILQPSEISNVKLSVLTPSNATYGTYSFNVSVYPERGLELRKEISLTLVVGYLGLELSLENSSKILLGCDLDYNIRIKNTGSISDRYRLSFSNVPDGWIAEFPDGKQVYYPTLDKNSSLELKVRVRIPEEVSHGRYSIKIVANSTTQPEVSDSLTLTYPIYSDLELVDATLPTGTIEIGKEVKLSAIVANKGIAIAENVTVKFYAEQYLIGQHELGALLPGTKMVSTFNWIVNSRKNESPLEKKLIVYVEGSDEVNELNLTNNQYVHDLSIVNPKNKEINSVQFSITLIALILCVICILLVVAKPRMRNSQTLTLNSDLQKDKKIAHRKTKKNKPKKKKIR